MKKIIAIMVLAMAWVGAKADSPLTSTDFADVYSDSQWVQQAAGLIDEEAGAEMSTSLMNFLADPKSPVDERLAVINKLGWNFNGQVTGGQLYNYLLGRYKAKDEKQLAKKMDGGTLAVYAYAKAMSNYFNVTEASELGHQAVKKDKTHSFSVAFISALIDAQIYLDSDWAMVYKVVNDVTMDGSLNLDMRQAAIDKVMEYINLYKEYVK
ncbi:MAG: hypothetical protein IJU62_06470 [Muribaculaceae bacterium]|nr:hypothetical protein [Muribaculaceae bacterium]